MILAHVKSNKQITLTKCFILNESVNLNKKKWKDIDHFMASILK